MLDFKWLNGLCNLAKVNDRVKESVYFDSYASLKVIIINGKSVHCVNTCF